MLPIRPVWPQLIASLAVALALFLVAAPISARASSSDPDQDPAQEAITAQYARMAPVPAAYAIIRGQDTVFGGQHGAGPDTRFIIGSVSKSFTALTVLAEVQRGRVELDAPVERYLPDLRLRRGGAAVTVRHLLSHTAGIGIGDCNKDGKRTYDSLASRVHDVRDVQLETVPGERFEYCNVGYAVLARMIEVESGRPFAEMLRTNVIEPLGLAGTETSLREARSAGLAEGRTTILGVPIAWPERANESALPDGYVVSTVRDLAAYARFQMGDGTSSAGVRLVSLDLMRQMHTAQVAVPGSSPEIAGYGLGWFVGTDDARTVVWHGGTTYRYQADVAMLPAEGRAVVSLAAGQWLAGTKPLTEASISGLLDRETAPSRVYLISTTILWIMSAALVITVMCSLRGQRRRRATGRRPRRWTIGLLMIGAGLLPVVVLLPAIQQVGSLAAAIRWYWLAVPDALLLELAWWLTVLWVVTRALADRRRTPDLSHTAPGIRL